MWQNSSWPAPNCLFSLFLTEFIYANAERCRWNGSQIKSNVSEHLPCGLGRCSRGFGAEPLNERRWWPSAWNESRAPSEPSGRWLRSIADVRKIYVERSTFPLISEAIKGGDADIHVQDGGKVLQRPDCWNQPQSSLCWGLEDGNALWKLAKAKKMCFGDVCKLLT